MPDRTRPKGTHSGPATTTVSVCRGCCCGTTRKHPGVDHQGHLRLLRELLDTGERRAARLRVTECLGHCGVSNLIVIHPSPAARQRGARPVWLGFVLDERCVTTIAEWVLAGGPGIAPLPPELTLHDMTPRRIRSGSR